MTAHCLCSNDLSSSSSSTPKGVAFLHFLLLAHSSTAVVGANQPAQWTVHPSRLPTGPLSDHTATVMPVPLLVDENDDGDEKAHFIVLAGGCNSELGNVFVDVDDQPEEGIYDYFACSSLTKEVWVFDPTREGDGEGDGNLDGGGWDGPFYRLADMPRERYRHAAVYVPPSVSSGRTEGKLVLIGGRTLEDAMIPEIDVYDPTTNTWSTPASLSEVHQTSDNAAFVDPSGQTLYVAGGYYGPDYITLDRVIAIDLDLMLPPSLSSTSPILNIKLASSLAEKRGDVHAVVSPDDNGEGGAYAYVAGGLTDANDFCSPLSSTERYDFDSDAWTTVAPLEHGRGDKALVWLRGKMYAMGGESRPDDWCDDLEGGDNLVRDQSAVLDDVEVFDPSASGTGGSGGGGLGAWEHIDDIPNARFRFAAAPWEATNVIYAFGGQEPLDAECQCHKTSDVIATIDLDGAVGTLSSSGANVRGMNSARFVFVFVAVTSVISGIVAVLV